MNKIFNAYRLIILAVLPFCYVQLCLRSYKLPEDRSFVWMEGSVLTVFTIVFVLDIIVHSLICCILGYILKVTDDGVTDVFVNYIGQFHHKIHNSFEYIAFDIIRNKYSVK